jgi:HKD family nuclease
MDISFNKKRSHKKTTRNTELLIAGMGSKNILNKEFLAMTAWKLLARDWKSDLANLFHSVNKRLIVSSPYVTQEGAKHLLSNLPPNRIQSIHLDFLTDLSPVNIYQASTDPDAIHNLAEIIPNFKLMHLPRLHAKAYIADSQNAIVTSANLTAGGLERNYEYGLLTNSTSFVSRISEEITEYSELGAFVSIKNLIEYCEITKNLRKVYKQQQRSIQYTLRKEFERYSLSAEDSLIRLRLAGGAMHTVFAKTILYLLRRFGAMPTICLHPRIQQIHPDLCDDTVDRIIDGRHFGKKWKHAVRTAQQQLKKQNLTQTDRF